MENFEFPEMFVIPLEAQNKNTTLPENQQNSLEMVFSIFDKLL